VSVAIAASVPLSICHSFLPAATRRAGIGLQPCLQATPLLLCSRGAIFLAEISLVIGCLFGAGRYAAKLSPYWLGAILAYAALRPDKYAPQHALALCPIRANTFFIRASTMPSYRWHKNNQGSFEDAPQPPSFARDFGLPVAGLGRQQRRRQLD
jgi:hypothetical protein